MYESVASIAGKFNTGGVFLEAEIVKEGIINSSYLITVSVGETICKYILQRINTGVFHSPHALMNNISKICAYIDTVQIVRTPEGSLLYKDDVGGFWRCLTYVDNTYTINPSLPHINFFEAGVGIGRFHRSLLNFPVRELEITIPDFHNTAARIVKFDKAVNSGNPARIAEAAGLIERFQARRQYALLLINQIDHSSMPLRVVHNDTNLNNILFDKATDKSVCMIDLDTVMPGYIIHDFGDVARHCLLIMKNKTGSLDINSFSLLTEGFLSQVEDFITSDECSNLFSGLWLITYELGLRFLTDYFENDVYFRIQNEKDNLYSAERQLSLLKDIDKNTAVLNQAIDRCFSLSITKEI